MALRRRASGRGTGALLAASGVVAIVLLGALDYATPRVVSLAVVYVLVVVVLTLLSGVHSGLAAGAASAIAWSVGDSATGMPGGDWAYLVNGSLRFLALALVALLVSALARALVDARESDQRSRDFLSAAAHQLRTPIAALRASADTLLCTTASPAQEQSLAHLANETARAGRLINSLLRMTRLDQGEPVRLECAAPAQVVDEELDRMRHLSPLTFTLDIGAGVPSRVLFDVRATREALANVLDNARRHAVASVLVSVVRDDRQVHFIVRDDGPGLLAGLEDRVFDRFVSLDRNGGSGLGLPIARSLLRLQGGDVVFRDGAFVLSLPPGTHRSPPAVSPKAVGEHAGSSAGDHAQLSPR